MSEEKTQQLLYQMQLLEAYFAELTQKENTMVTVLREAHSAIESIKGINAQTDSETLVPVGLGTFVKAKISSNNKIVLNVGAGVAIEKDKDSALNYLESKIKEVEVALQETVNQKQQLASKLEQGKQEMNKLLQTTAAPKKN